MAKKKIQTAILLLCGDDQQGIVATVTDFIGKNNGNIVSLDEHVDSEGHLFMRVEWNLEHFGIPKEKVTEYFQTIVGAKYGLNFSIHFNESVPRVALFVSKYSHCLFDILHRYESGEWKIEIPLIISNHDKFRYVGERYDIPYYHLPITKETKPEVEKEQHHLMQKHGIDLIVLARYMQVLSGSFCNKYTSRIINIHHSTLPAFAGANPYRAAYERGVKFMGATAHYVTEELDAGPIIRQGVLPISHLDTISEMKRKGRNIEKIVLADAVWAHLNHKIIAHGNKTVVFN